jgi:glycosidase
MVWDDMQYQPECYLPDGTTHETPDTVEVNIDLLQTYRKLIRIRHQHPALSLGDFQTLLVDNQNQIYAYRRSFEGQIAIIALNNTRQTRLVELNIASTGTLKDVLNNNAEQPTQDGKVRLSLAPLWGSILVAE